MADPLETLINDIAIKHGVVIGRDDPILILQTMNSKLMEENAKTQQLMLNQYKEDLEGISLRWGNEAKEKSERILNASLTASKEAMANLLQESAHTTALTIQNNIEELLSRAKGTLRHTKQIAMLNLAASALTLLAAGAVIVGLFR